MHSKEVREDLSFRKKKTKKDREKKQMLHLRQLLNLGRINVGY
jgi:hypothetical protein